MTVLGIDTSNQSMSLCLGDEDNLIGSFFAASQKNHSTTLMPAIDFLMTSNNKKPQDINKIIVAEGPGSYTGLRIGVTTAKTLAWTLGVDLYSISSLALIAATKKSFEGLIIPVINARRENVYTGAYKWEEGQLVTVIADQHISFDIWLERLSEMNLPVFFIGADLKEFTSMIEKKENKLLNYDESRVRNEINPASLLELDFQSRKIEDVESFIPCYLKKVEAEEKWLEIHSVNEKTNYVERV